MVPASCLWLRHSGFGSSGPKRQGHERAQATSRDPCGASDKPGGSVPDHRPVAVRQIKAATSRLCGGKGTARRRLRHPCTQHRRWSRSATTAQDRMSGDQDHGQILIQENRGQYAAKDITRAVAKSTDGPHPTGRSNRSVAGSVQARASRRRSGKIDRRVASTSLGLGLLVGLDPLQDAHGPVAPVLARPRDELRDALDGDRHG